MKPRLLPMGGKPAGAQSGIVLPVVLIFLVIMMLLGITAIRNVTLEERMAGNSRYQQLAFQAGELALRSCEGQVLGTAAGQFFDVQPSLPLGAVPVVAGVSAPFWDPTSVNQRWGDNTFARAVVLPAAYGGLMTAQCMVERLAPTTPKQKGGLPYCPFRVTARVNDVVTNSGVVVLLQSYLIAPLNSGRSCPIAP